MKISLSKLLALAIVALFLPFAAYAEGEGGTWLEATVEKKLPKKWWKNADDFSVNAGVSYRLGENFGQSTRFDVSAGVDYKVNKWLKMGAAYMYILNHRAAKMNDNDRKYDDVTGELIRYEWDEAYWRNRHRGLFELTAKHKFGRFTISLRERYQYTFTAADSTKRYDYRFDGSEWQKDFDRWDDKKSSDEHVLRSRVKVEYDIKNCPLAPFFSYEIHNLLDDNMKIDKHRITVGTDWKVNKKHKLSFAYLLNAPDFKSDAGTMRDHVLNISYKFDF